MKLLDAVNLTLPKLGERPVTSLSVKHPTLAVLLPILDKNRKTLLMRGWWFNEYATTLYPDTSGVVAVGADVLSFTPKYPGAAVVRGARLFNPNTLTDVFSSPVPGTVRQDVDFEELPESAASYVLHSALVEAFTTDLGVTQELQVWQALSADAWSNLLSEHLRQKRHNTRDTRAWRRLIRAKNV